MVPLERVMRNTIVTHYYRITFLASLKVFDGSQCQVL